MYLHVLLFLIGGGLGYKLPTIFTEEVVSTEGSNHEVGTGLGLILCKQYIELNHGNIGVESEEGKGAKFYFTLLGI